jgi:hypothetical protein
MFHFSFKNIAGQAIIEAVVALATILVILSAISVAIITSVNNSDYIKKQTLAKKIAEQGMEHIRYLRNNSPGVFFAITPNETQCMGEDNSIGLCSGQINIPDYFKREVFFVQNSDHCVGGTLVTVTVRWTSGKCDTGEFCHSSKLVSCFQKISDSLRSL